MMREDMIMIVAKVLKKYLPQLKFHLESVPDNFGQDHSEFSDKTGVKPLPLLNLNENCKLDVTKILDLYINEESIQIGGDQLRGDRFDTSWNLRLGNLHKRFANFRPTTFVFFHLGMNFLDKIIFEPLWSSERKRNLVPCREKDIFLIKTCQTPMRLIRTIL